MLEGTISELLKRCGDDRGRFVSSTFDFGLGDMGKQTVDMSVEYKSSVMAGAAMVVSLALMIKLDI